MQRYGEQYDRPALRLSGPVIQALRDYAWPGNVRELQNLVERLVSLSAADEIVMDELPEELSQAHGNGWAAGNGVSTDRPFHEAKADAIAAFEKAYLHELLSRHGGNISQAARDAGIDRKTIHRMLMKYDLDDARL
jgi:DNA-binding NtrC family response regulator